MKMSITSLDELAGVATQVLDHLVKTNQKFVIFKGEMGVGKTTLINEMVQQMGIEGSGSSPTFSIINEYFSVNYGTIYHFDFYRIEDETEAFDIGIEEIFEKDAYVFIEWPERIKNLLPPSIVCLNMTEENQVRTIEVTDL
ncbi:MAG: tRNA (adenosine(37)-N6)-threonylcarbamoyltransferase complex ATPase subunit type 1 TsaE [Crocinitomicaceae bacterium]